MVNAKVKEIFRILFTYLLDPPGWIPAWVFTGFLLMAARDSLNSSNQETLAVFQTMSHTYEIVLGIWLGYKGVKSLPDIIAAWKDGK